MAGNDYDGIKYREEKGGPPLIFRLLLGALVIWGIGFMGYYLFSGWSSDKEFADKKKQEEARMAAAQKSEAVTVPGTPLKLKEGNPAEYIAAGKKIFAERCAACHGENAKGGIGPDLTRADFKYGRTSGDISESVAKGRPGGMPAFGTELNHEQLEGVVQYILSLK